MAAVPTLLLGETDLDGGTPFTSSSFSTTAGRPVVVIISASCAGPGFVNDDVAVTGPGGTYASPTPPNTVAYGTRRRRWVRVLADPATATGTLSAVYTQGTGGAIQEWHVEIYEIVGGDTTTPFGPWITATTDNDTALSPTIDVTGAAAGDCTLASIGLESDIAIGFDAAWALLNSEASANGIRKSATYFDDGFDATPAWTWTGTNGAGGFGVLVKAAAGGAGPIPDAGPDQVVDSSEVVTLDGSGSTGAGTLTYLWAQTAGTTVTLNDDTLAQPQFTAPTGPDTLTFELTVTDDDGFDTDTVGITVNAPPSGSMPMVVRVSGAWTLELPIKVRISGVWV